LGEENVLPIHPLRRLDECTRISLVHAQWAVPCIGRRGGLETQEWVVPARGTIYRDTAAVPGLNTNYRRVAVVPARRKVLERPLMRLPRRVRPLGRGALSDLAGPLRVVSHGLLGTLTGVRPP
jgi:hypothetical protein